MSSTEHPNEQAAARPECDHHWVSRHQPDFPPEIYWVQVCSLCGDINGGDLSAEVVRLSAEMDALRVQRNSLVDRVLAAEAQNAELRAKIEAVEKRANFESSALNESYRRGFNNAMGQIRAALGGGFSGGQEQGGQS